MSYDIMLNISVEEESEIETQAEKEMYPKDVILGRAALHMELIMQMILVALENKQDNASQEDVLKTIDGLTGVACHDNPLKMIGFAFEKEMLRKRYIERMRAVESLTEIKKAVTDTLMGGNKND